MARGYHSQYRGGKELRWRERVLHAKLVACVGESGRRVGRGRDVMGDCRRRREVKVLAGGHGEVG